MNCGQYYSVILKACSRRENLSHRLESILLRSRLAIKMALDNIPSVIIYKGKTDNILTVLNAFKAESAAITVLVGGVPEPLPFSTIYRDYAQLQPELASLLNFVPAKLWIGEKIYRVFPASIAEETGALVITSHAIYFIDKPQGYKDSRWLIIPYGQIAGIPAITASALTLTYLDATGMQNFVFKVDSQWLHALISAIHQARSAKRYLIKLKTTCIKCGITFEDYTDTVIAETHCRSCGGQYQRLII